MPRFGLCLLAFSTGCFGPSYPVDLVCSERSSCPDGYVCDRRDDRCREGPLPECLSGEECESKVCDSTSGMCANPSCQDMAKNGDETHVDCGGGTCQPCRDGDPCDRPIDCISGSCNQGLCAPMECGDGIVNAAAGEDCDTAGPSPTCDADCTFPACGDGVVNVAAGEECDNPDGECCSNDCRLDAAGTVCRSASTGGCDIAERCDGVNAACPAEQFQVAGTACRPADGVCDAPESCTGSSAACPPDEFRPPGTECRGATGDCDAPESCTGSSAACPSDELRSPGTECRGASGDCDAPETCTGSSATCPSDELRPPGTECRGVAGECDVPESCDGSSAACPDDQFVAAGTSCRGAAGECDLEESCDGLRAACPDDVRQPSGFECRPGTSDCDAAEQCDGEATACPIDLAAPDGADCDDCASPPCDSCSGGICLSVCGNDSIDEAEQCDGNADGSCPGQCGSDCLCRALPTCLAYHEADTSSPSGRYYIDPDGDTGGVPPFLVPCDMTPDDGGWTLIEYESDLPLQRHFDDGLDLPRYLEKKLEFEPVLQDEQIEAIRRVSSEFSQRYVGLCQGVVHYQNAAGTFRHAFGFLFQDGVEAPNGRQDYGAPFNIRVRQDGCRNEGDGTEGTATIFDIGYRGIPVMNVESLDNGEPGEMFGSPLTQNPARMR